MGCLTLPFRLLGLLLLVALLAAGWLYRDEIADLVRGRLGHRAPAGAEGRPSAAALARARRAMGGLSRGADSVLLDADESASLLREALGPLVSGQVDSIRLDLSEGRIGFRASLRTARLPRELLGPLSAAVRSREPISAAGSVRTVAPGRAAWEIDRLSIRDIPLPRDAVPKLLGRAFGDTTRRALPLELPPPVAAIRVHPEGIALLRRDGP